MLRRAICVLCTASLAAVWAVAQVPHPSEVFSFTPGDDYKLATYQQMVDYYEALDAASDRVALRRIGTSVLGRPLLLLFISSEENLRDLERWRAASEKLARARVSDEEAVLLAEEGKAVVWIDGGLHATEVAGAQMTPLLAWRVATEESAEMRHIREHVVLMLMPVMNPDGLDIIASWYAHTLDTPYEATQPPWLYHHYVGHDNNRDWFMNNMPESQAVTDVLYNEWYPQIVYNHHQTSPSWTRIFLPPFADPVNPRIHPGVTTGVNLVGTAMANRFAMRKMPGVVSGVIYSMWWNGGMRTVPYFHNMIGILTETGHATASPRFFDPDSIPQTVGGRRGAGHPTSGTNIFYPYPWEGGPSHFRDPVRYMITGSLAVLRLAADRKRQWLYNIYAMGRDAIERRDGHFAYVIPAAQWNKGEDLSLVNLLRLGGIEIERATEAFEAAGESYAAGSFIIKTAQPFRPYVEDLLERQDYPDRRRTPDGPPETPYDLAGWTLPLQMGVNVVRADSAFEAATVPVTAPVRHAPGTVVGSGPLYLFSRRPNRNTEAALRLLKAGAQVYWLADTLRTDSATVWEPGTFMARGRRRAIEETARETGADFIATDADPERHALREPRVGLYKSWVSSMDEGWTRWLLKSYTFAVDTLHDADVQSRDLAGYDAIILPSQSPSAILRGHGTGLMPDPYTGGLGVEGALALKAYVEGGGMVVALDAASDFVIEQFGLPVENVVAGTSERSFFIPGSLVRIEVDTSSPLGFGMQPETAASFVRSRAFSTVRRSPKGEGGAMQILPAPPLPVEVVARYPEEDLLMSGWALGAESHIGGAAAMLQVGLGRGRVVLFGFRPQFRGQSRVTYKLLFNALLASTID